MTKAELVARIAEKAGISKSDADKNLKALLDTIEDTLAKDGKLVMTGFGTFSVDERKARTGRNPSTGAEIQIPATNVVKFRPGKALKDAVN